MKRILITSVCMLIFACSSFAQQKLWTWKPDNESATHAMHAAAMHASGAAAFVVAEFGGGAKKSYQIVWIGKDGKVILIKRIPTDDEQLTLTGIESGGNYWKSAKWRVAFLGPNALAVRQGNILRIYTSKGGRVPSVKILDADAVEIFETNGFSGWLEKKGNMLKITIPGSGENGEDASVSYQNVQALSALRL